MVARVRHKDLPSRVYEDALRAPELIDAAAGGAERGPPSPSHVVDAHDAIVACICHEDLTGGIHKDGEGKAELVDSLTAGAECGPASPRHVVDADDARVSPVRHEDMSAGVHEDAHRSSELIDPLAGGAERIPTRPGPSNGASDCRDRNTRRYGHHDSQVTEGFRITHLHAPWRDRELGASNCPTLGHYPMAASATLIRGTYRTLARLSRLLWKLTTERCSGRGFVDYDITLPVLLECFSCAHPPSRHRRRLPLADGQRAAPRDTECGEC